MERDGIEIMEPIATYCVRVDSKRINRIKDHWKHHKPLCINGLVCLDDSSFTDENVSVLEELGLKVCRGDASGNFDKNLAILQKEGLGLEGDWYLTLDSDEYIPPFFFKDILIAAHESEAKGQQWLRAWMCDRLSEGGYIHADPENYSYATLNRDYPVMADVTKKIQGSCNAKCFLAKKPDIGMIHYRRGNPHPTWFRLDHFKWFGDVVSETDARSKVMWTGQYSRTVDHFEKNGRIAAENCLSSMWESRSGWFDFWDLYKEVAEEFKGCQNVKLVEVGVWQGRSATFLSQILLALGVDYELYLVDKFKGCEATGAHLKKVDPHLTSTSSFIDKVTSHFHQNGIAQRANFIQLDSVTASRVFDANSVDFVFIDDDHSYEAVKAGVSAWLPKIKPGGILSGHDYNHPSVYKAVNEILQGVIPKGHSWFYRK